MKWTDNDIINSFVCAADRDGHLLIWRTPPILGIVWRERWRVADFTGGCFFRAKMCRVFECETEENCGQI